MFGDFREGRSGCLHAEGRRFAVDLPGASIAIPISGTWGSRQEEAHGWAECPRQEGANQAVFYSLISEDTHEQELAEKRQLFLAEQNYPYRIEHMSP